jgi:DNA-binding SARP family transcriptional activator
MCKALTDHYFQIKHFEDAARWATVILTENRYDEDAHRQLIRIYAAQGRRHEALQQYQRCERLLGDELGVQPLPETLLVLQHLLTSEASKEKI